MRNKILVPRGSPCRLFCLKHLRGMDTNRVRRETGKIQNSGIFSVLPYITEENQNNYSVFGKMTQFGGIIGINTGKRG